MSRTVLNLTCHLKKTPKNLFFMPMQSHASLLLITQSDVYSALSHAESCDLLLHTQIRMLWSNSCFFFLFHMQSHEIQYFIANKIKCLEHSLSSTCIKQSYSNIKSVLKSQLQVIFWHRLFHSLILLLALKQVFSGLRSLMGFILMKGTSHLGVNRGFLSDCHNLRSFKYIVNMHKYLVILKTQPFCDAREQNIVAGYSSIQ